MSTAGSSGMVPDSKFVLDRRTLMRLGLVGGVAMPLLAACDSGGNETTENPLENSGSAAMDEYKAGDIFKANEALTFGILWTDWPETPVKDSWEIFDKLAATTNVTLETTNIPLSDHVEKRSLLISAGDAPYIIPLIYAGEEKQWAATGVVLPMSDYIEEMPHFKKLADEWDLWDLINNLKVDDGKYYMLPGLQEVSVPSFSMIVRKDIFNELGYDPLPDSWDDWKEAFAAAKAKYPDSIPLQDGNEGLSLINWGARAFGTDAGWGFGGGMQWDADAGEFIYTGTSDEYKEMLEFFHGLVADGLLDPASFTTTTEGTDRVERLIAAEQAFAGAGNAATVGEWTAALNATVGEGNFELVLVPPPSGPAGPIIGQRGFWHGFMIMSKAAEDPNFKALIQFMDWLYYSPESTWFLRWGVEGEQYTRDAEDKVTLLPDFKYGQFGIGTGSIDIQVDLGYSTVPSGGTESRALKESYQSEAVNAYMDQVLSTRTPRDPMPPAPLTAEELESSSLQGTALKDAVDTATLQFIVGDRDLAEWDTYVAEIESIGVQQYLDLMNGARERFAENNG